MVMISTKNANNSYTIWQEIEEGVPEPALLVSLYSDIINIRQENSEININYETIKPLIKFLSTIKTP